MEMKRNFNKFSAVILAAVLISFTMLFPAAAAQPDIPIPEDKIDPVLLARMGAAEDGKTIPVSVWFKDIDQDSVSRQVQDTLQRQTQNGILSEETLLLSQYNTAAAPQARAIPAALENMDEASQISTAAAAAGSISLTYQTITGAKEMRDAYNYTGEGVKVGILEGAVPDKTNPVFAHMFHAGNPQADRFHIVKQTNNTESGHVTSVAAIIAAETETFSAIAPDVDLYCAGVQDAVTGAIRWKEGMEALLDAGVNIINASYSLIGDTWGEYGDSSRWVDHVIWEHNVSVCIGSGNNRNVISGAMAYNAITVGNIDDQKTLNLSDDKRYDKWYSGIHYQSAYSDSALFACKPDIMAPGARAGTPVNPMQSIEDDYGGTSYAAPIVVGILAQLLEMKPVYKALPVALKTTLLAGAVKTQEMIDCDEDVDPDNDIDSVKYGDRIALDRKNGAGMVNVLQAAEILESGQLFYHPNFGGNTKIIQVQFSAHGGDRLQICLNWLKPSIITGSHVTTDALDIVQEHLRLSVYNSNGKLLYSSDLLSDTKQYIAFTPAKADTYIFKAEKISNQSNGVPVTLSWYQN